MLLAVGQAADERASGRGRFRTNWPPALPPGQTQHPRRRRGRGRHGRRSAFILSFSS